MTRLVSWVEALTSSLGGAGLFIVAFLDSSFLSLPEINDVLVIMLITRNEALMPYYVSMATAGSVAGCLVLHAIGRRGGAAMLHRRFGGPRVERAMRLFERFGILAVVVPALLPPPAPFKVFVLLSGVVRVPVLTFCVSVAAARGLRYSVEGVLAVRYGDQAIALLEARAPEVTLALLGLVAVVVVTYLIVGWRRRRQGGRWETS